MTSRLARAFAALALILAGIAGTAAPAQAAARPVYPSHLGQTMGAIHARTACSSPCFFYAGGFQAGMTSLGVQAGIQVNKPYLNTADYHSLAEIAVQGGTSNGQAVEVGWTVDRALNGDDQPHLFGSVWVNGVWKGYNAAAGTSWVDNTSNATNLGASLSAVASDPTFANRQKTFLIQYDNTVSCGAASAGWWLKYDSAYVGCYPITLWTGATPSVNFNQDTQVQAYGEVAAASTTPCSDEGNGKLGSSTVLPLDATDSAYIASVSLASGSVATNLTANTPTNSAYYNYQGFASGGVTRTFAYGGYGSGSVVGGC